MIDVNQVEFTNTESRNIQLDHRLELVPFLLISAQPTLIGSNEQVFCTEYVTSSF